MADSCSVDSHARGSPISNGSVVRGLPAPVTRGALVLPIEFEPRELDATLLCRFKSLKVRVATYLNGSHAGQMGRQVLHIE